MAQKIVLVADPGIDGAVAIGLALNDPDLDVLGMGATAGNVPGEQATSNLQTNIYDTFTDHPINRLYELGLSVSVNTDARTITNITLSEEYEKLHRFFA